MVFRRSLIDGPVRDMLGRAVWVTEKLRMMLSWVTWVFTLVLIRPRVRISQVSDDEIVSWRERRFHAYEVIPRTKRNYDARSHLSVPVENSLHSTAGDLELTEEHGDHDGHEGELGARVLAPLYSSTGRRFRKCEDVVLDAFACNYEDHPAEMRVTSLRSNWLPCTTSLQWTHCVGLQDFAMAKHWHSSDAVFQQLQGLLQIWYTAGTYDQLNLVGVAAMEELAK